MVDPKKMQKLYDRGIVSAAEYTEMVIGTCRALDAVAADAGKLMSSERNTRELTSKESQVFGQLLDASEGWSDGVWQEVYLDNCPMRSSDPRTFAGVLGSLTSKGLYRSGDDDCFGEVYIAEGRDENRG